jgi:ATP-dependent protease HslVU (ClpYQ) peptidase subunit
MTTVVFKDGVMAGDSRGNDVNIGNIIIPKVFRKKIKGKTYLFGVAGYWDAALMFIEWYKTRDKELKERLIRLPGESGFDVLIWDGVKLMYSDEFMYLTELTEPYYAIGSGAAYAITAMDCGKSARQAVQMAMKRDSNTAGRVVSMKL